MLLLPFRNKFVRRDDMKMIAGVLLSLSLLLTGLPVPSQNPAWCNTESTTKEVKETGSETDVQQEEAGTTRKENVQGEEDGQCRQLKPTLPHYTNRK